MTTLTTMMNWYGPDAEVVEKECCECHCKMTLPARNSWIQIRCETCAEINDSKRKLKTEIDYDLCTENPIIDLVGAIITRAVVDAKNGNGEARSFLRAQDGAMLYLKAAGIEVTPEIERRLYWIGKERNEKVKLRARQLE